MSDLTLYQFSMMVKALGNDETKEQDDAPHFSSFAEIEAYRQSMMEQAND